MAAPRHHAAAELKAAAAGAKYRRMCGRYAAFKSVDEIRRAFGTVNPPPNFDPTWNMAPTRLAPVVRLHPQTHARHLDLLRWGLVPHWAKDAKTTRQPINARSESAATSPMFRDALTRRRCIVPADAFYEWQVRGGAKIPYAVARADGDPLAIAGLWEGWRGADAEVLRTFTILTTDANDTLRPLHERMPVVLEKADWPVWLGEREGDYAALLRPSLASLRVWRVAPAVNNARNDSAALLEEAA
jgi:putative SOS response-associated peptidase YedK